jgi:hypothetical protein
VKFCSLLYAVGEVPPVVMREMGHTDPGLALKVYAQVMESGEAETAALRELVEGGVLANETANETQIEPSTPSTAGQPAPENG